MSLEEGNAALREGRFDEARDHFEKAADEAGADRRRYALALHGLALIENGAGNHAGVATHYREAIDQLRGSDDRALLARVLRHCAESERTLGRLEAADKGLDEALGILRDDESTVPLTLANALRVRALLEEDFGSLGPAKALWVEARDLYLATGIEDGVEEADRSIRRLVEG